MIFDGMNANHKKQMTDQDIDRKKWRSFFKSQPLKTPDIGGIGLNSPLGPQSQHPYGGWG